MTELSVFSDFSHKNVYEFARKKGRKVQGNENKGCKRSMWKYRMRKGNEGNVTKERERKQVSKPKSRNICNKIKLLATNLTLRLPD